MIAIHLGTHVNTLSTVDPWQRGTSAGTEYLGPSMERLDHELPYIIGDARNVRFLWRRAADVGASPHDVLAPLEEGWEMSGQGAA